MYIQHIYSLSMENLLFILFFGLYDISIRGLCSREKEERKNDPNVEYVDVEDYK